MPPRRGPRPSPRLSVNPDFYPAVRESVLPQWEITYRAGLRHSSQLQRLLQHEVPDTPGNREQLERIAEVVGFDRSQLFVECGQ